MLKLLGRNCLFEFHNLKSSLHFCGKSTGLFFFVGRKDLPCTDKMICLKLLPSHDAKALVAMAIRIEHSLIDSTIQPCVRIERLILYRLVELRYFHAAPSARQMDGRRWGRLGLR